MRLDDIRTALARDGRAVVVLVAEAHGSAPREAGAAMLVAPGGTLGTVGGGTVEHRAVEAARAMLAGEAGPRAELDFPLGPALDQCCGGRMHLAFALLTAEEFAPLPVAPDPAATRHLAPCGGGPGRGSATPADTRDSADERPLPLQGGESGWGSAEVEPGGAFELWPGGPVYREPPPPRQIFVYGAGHVGRALVAALAPLPFLTIWVDARAGALAGAPEGIEAHETPLPEAIAETAEPDALHVVLTHSHALDLEIVTAVMQRPFGFCGLIGSGTKRALFRRKLAERGIPAATIERLTCPIGLPALRDKRPAVIAASVAAQLLQADAALAARLPATEAG